jgi:hypothetical protein
VLTASIAPLLALAMALGFALGVVGVGLAGSAAEDETLRVGQTLPELGLTDQHERLGEVGAGTRLVLFAPDRESGELAHGVLEATGGETLAQAGIRYVADISAMPGLVTRMFALPKMREYGYTMLLGRESADTAMLPRRPGELTLIELEAGSITDLSYAGTEAALRAALAPYLTP